MRAKRMGLRARILWVLLPAVAVFALDQLTKLWARDFLGHGTVHFLPGVLDFRLVSNTGAAWGAFANSTFALGVFSVVVSVGLLLLAFLRAGKMGRPLVLSLALIAGGGLGNAYDRLAHGEVTDFLSASFVDFPVFNVADVAVTCGCALLILCLFYGSVRGGGLHGHGAERGAAAGDAGHTNHDDTHSHDERGGVR